MDRKPSRQILIIDDDEIMQRLIQEYFSKRGYDIHQAMNCTQGTQILQQTPIDTIVLDIQLPDQNGLHYLPWLRQHQPDIPVLVLSSHCADQDRIASLEAGAADYLAKPFVLRELELRLERLFILRNASGSGKKASQHFDFQPEAETVVKNDRTIKLTHVETQILQYLYDHPGKVISRDELFHALYGNDHHPLDRRIDVHINNLRKKIEDNPAQPALLKTVWGKGYRFHKGETAHV